MLAVQRLPGVNKQTPTLKSLAVLFFRVLPTIKCIPTTLMPDSFIKFSLLKFVAFAVGEFIRDSNPLGENCLNLLFSVTVFV